MLREMGTFGAVMTVILLVLIAIKSILHYLNPKGKIMTRQKDTENIDDLFLDFCRLQP